MNNPLRRQYLHAVHAQKGYADIGAKAAQIVGWDRVNAKLKRKVK